MRLAVVAAICLSVVGAAGAGNVTAAIREPTTIAAQPLGSALQELARDRNFQLICNADLVRGLKTHGFSGQFTPGEALTTLLTGTGLTYRYLDARTVTVVPGALQSGGAGPALPPNGPASPGASHTETKEGKKSSSVGFRVAQVDQAAARPEIANSGQSAAQLQEVVVSAQKRDENLLTVPVPVTAISAAALTENNQVRLQDYFSSIPALSVSPAGFPGNTQMLAIRGLSSGAYTNPTVGVLVDDVPFGSSSGQFGGNNIPDFDPSDLARVEVLRGPQGTLYGADSMGGLLKFVTVDPSTDAFSGRVQADSNWVQNASEAGYGFRGAVNVPVSDTFAIRGSAFARQDPGYIDNPILDVNGLNEDHVYGTRVSALWRPAGDFSLKLSALYQKTKADGTSDVDVPTSGYPETAGLGDLQQNYLRGCCGYDKELQAYSAVMNGHLGIVNLTSVSGYNVNKFDTSFDYSYLFGGFIPGFDGAGDYSHGKTDKFTQEIRASMPIGSMIEWLVGAYYSHEDIGYNLSLLGQDSATGEVGGLIFHGNGPITNSEYAGFTDVTIHFTDQFDIQVGGRESHIEQDAKPVVFIGPLFGGTVDYPEATIGNNAFTYLVTPEFKFSSDLMLYARIASGYRPGVPNNFNVDPLIPRASVPDKTQNYEIGVKGNVLDHMLTLDASVYYIDWKNIQIELFDSNPNPLYHDLTYTTNGSAAKSEGVELSVESRPITGLTVASWITYDDAVLTENMPPASSVYGPAGSRLPYGTRFSGNLSVNQTFPLVGLATGFVGTQVSYVGSRLGTFIPLSSTPRAEFPSYTKIDLRGGANYGPWTLNLYANNIANKRGVLGGGPGTYPPFAYYYIQPRTIGASLTRTF